MYAAAALPTIRFQDMGGKMYELSAQTDCWPAPADLRADAPAPVIVSADEGAIQMIYACSDGEFRPLTGRREWLAEQQKDALVLARLPGDVRGAVAGYVRGVAGSDRALPLLPMRPVALPVAQLTQVSGYGWLLSARSREARVFRRTEANGDNGDIHIITTHYGWGADDVPPTRSGQHLAEINGAHLLVTESPLPPVLPEGWTCEPHVPSRTRIELDLPDLQVVAVRPLGGRCGSDGRRQERWLWAICR